MQSTQAVPQPTLVEDPTATTLLLVRHGRSADVVPGSPESADPPLHVLGVQQAAALARRLDGLPLDAVYASNLRRSIDTAAALAEPRGLAVGIDPELEEVRLGDWAMGEFRRRAAIRDPEWVAWSRTGRWDGIPGAEGDAAFRARVVQGHERIAAAHPGQRVAVVTHGGVINAYLAAILGLPRSIWLTVENTSISVVHIGDLGHTVVVAGDCSHLYDPVRGAGA